MDKEIDGKVIHIGSTGSGSKALHAANVALMAHALYVSQREQYEVDAIRKLQQTELDTNIMAPNKGIHRSTPTSKRGRQMNNIARPVDLSQQSQEVKDWNAQVEVKKAAKLAAKGK